MSKFSTEKYFKNPAIRRYRKTAAFAVLGVIIGAALMATALLLFSHYKAPVIDYVAPEEVIQEVDIEVLQASKPTHIRIPSIEVDAVFETPLGVSKSYEIEVPESYETVGWYKHGPTPGEVGPAVVLGHVDSYQGPAVLFSLGQVEVGETIEIDREDGSTAIFEVEALEKHEQTGFPTEKVYSDLDYPGLRLITCTGTYDKGVQRYSHNLIVFARLVEDGSKVKEEGEGE